MRRWQSGILLALFVSAAPLAAGEGDHASVATRLQRAETLRSRSREYLEAAAAEYRAVLQRDPQNLEAERGLGRVLRDSGAVEQALPYLRDAAQRSGDAVDDARLGWALLRAGKWAEAKSAFEAARRRGMNDAETLRGHALA